MPRLSLLLGFGLVLAGCGSHPQQPVSPPTTAQAHADDPTCPVLVAGTSVTVEDLDRGAALVFVTTSDVAGVRARAAALADAHNKRHAAMGAHAGHAGHAQMPDSQAMQMGQMIGVHSTATVAEVDGGARVEFAASGDDVAKLQSELRMHAQHLGNGTCEM